MEGIAGETLRLVPAPVEGLPGGRDKPLRPDDRGTAAAICALAARGGKTQHESAQGSSNGAGPNSLSRREPERISGRLHACRKEVLSIPRCRVDPRSMVQGPSR